MLIAILVGLQWLTMLGIGLLVTHRITKTNAHLAAIANALEYPIKLNEDTRACVRELHEARFGEGGPSPKYQRRRQPSDSGFRPARGQSNPDVEELEPKRVSARRGDP